MEKMPIPNNDNGVELNNLLERYKANIDTALRMQEESEQRKRELHAKPLSQQIKARFNNLGGLIFNDSDDRTQRGEQYKLYNEICSILRERPGVYPLVSVYHLLEYRIHESAVKTESSQPYVVQFEYIHNGNLKFKPYILMNSLQLKVGEQADIEIRKDNTPVLMVPQSGLNVFEYTSPSRINEAGHPQGIVYAKWGPIYSAIESMPGNARQTLISA